MTHKVLPRVLDVAIPDANRADVGRLKWRLALLPASWIVLSPVCIHVVVCVYISLWVDMFIDSARWYLVCCNRYNVVYDCVDFWLLVACLVEPSLGSGKGQRGISHKFPVFNSYLMCKFCAWVTFGLL